MCLRQPGAPTKVFADEGDDYPHKELLQKLLNAQTGQEGHYWLMMVQVFDAPLQLCQ